MDAYIKSQILHLINREVLPAVGCTEPVAVALCAAAVADLLGKKPDKVEVWLSANVLKNAMGVGIPGTGMTGLPIAIALGGLIARPEAGLEVLQHITPELLSEAKQFIKQSPIPIYLKEQVDKLYIEIRVISGAESAVAIISREHTRFVYMELNGEVIMDERNEDLESSALTDEDVRLSFDMVYDFAMCTPLEELTFIKEISCVNRVAADKSLEGNYGHTVGKIISGAYGRKYMGDTPFTRMMKVTAAACDARMDGAMIPVISNSGSGNQGIAATLPVLSFAEEINCNEEVLTRGLVLSHLMVIYIKQSLGRLSALCGCVVAATGAASAITYMMGGNKTQVIYAIKNMVGNLTGMICDGAKPSCALKVSSGVSTAMLSALMAMEEKVVTPLEGIIDEDIDQTILNLTSIGSVGMEATDKLVLEIMTHKN